MKCAGRIGLKDGQLGAGAIMALRESSGATLLQRREDLAKELLRSLHDAQRPVIVAVVAVRMVQVSVNKVANMIPVRHCLVPAAGTMNVAWSVRRAAMLGCAAIGIRC
jgi:hypothetical protein